MTELVATLLGTVQALGETTAVVVGHDWGAPVAWSAAWIRPEVFDAVVAVGVPFSGRGQMGFPGSVHGEVKPSEIERRIAGPDLLLYQEYFKQPGIAEDEGRGPAAEGNGGLRQLRPLDPAETPRRLQLGAGRVPCRREARGLTVCSHRRVTAEASHTGGGLVPIGIRPAWMSRSCTASWSQRLFSALLA
jgi:pimeloyl-ACP methyl ester carboxylesterase